MEPWRLLKKSQDKYSRRSNFLFTCFDVYEYIWLLVAKEREKRGRERGKQLQKDVKTVVYCPGGLGGKELGSKGLKLFTASKERGDEGKMSFLFSM